MYILRKGGVATHRFLSGATISLFVLCTAHCALELAMPIVLTKIQTVFTEDVVWIQGVYRSLIGASNVVYVTSKSFAAMQSGISAEASSSFRSFSPWVSQLTDEFGGHLFIVLSLAMSLFTTFVLVGLTGLSVRLSWSARYSSLYQWERSRRNAVSFTLEGSESTYREARAAMNSVLMVHVLSVISSSRRQGGNLGDGAVEREKKGAAEADEERKATEGSTNRGPPSTAKEGIKWLNDEWLPRWTDGSRQGRQFPVLSSSGFETPEERACGEGDDAAGLYHKDCSQHKAGIDRRSFANMVAGIAARRP
ncbi:hypothetical protein FB451DRAFT_1165031 [Mycena latifolia]|nr:hypothetical protein FB451DRAFT_1165031 [Mycena latifolia]